VISAGVDLASQPVRTASCEVTWSRGSATVTELVAAGADDPHISELIARSDKTGLDVPLGWPESFVAAVTAHHSRRAWPGGTQHALRFRLTDHHVWRATGRWPLSVSSDLIALPALRAAALLSAQDADRRGGGRVVEAYPAAALRRWGFDARGYKRRAGLEHRRVLVPGFRARTAGWLRLSDAHWRLCEASDDAFDALVAALIARAAALGMCDTPPVEQVSITAREGWIALPAADSLDRLARA
jgi:predicted nuclease with RNAse H fold